MLYFINFFTELIIIIYMASFVGKFRRRRKWLLMLSLGLFIIYYLFYHMKSSSHKGTLNAVTVKMSQLKSVSSVTIPVLNIIPNKKPQPCYNVHAFYYPWYGNPDFDNKYMHWNHRYIRHWNPAVANVYPNGVHEPPHDIGSNFYPALGPYSSGDPKVIDSHMQQLSFAEIGVIAVSFYPPGQGDDNGEDWQHLFSHILNAADRYKIKVAFHIEPYKDRSEVSVKSDIEYIIDSYSMFPAFYLFKHRGEEKPLIYIYDSYHTKPLDWAKLFKPGPESIRGTKYDSFVIGLVVEERHQTDMVTAGFDGFYTYFAANGFTFGSTRHNWEKLAQFASNHDLLFIPSVGPGYIDTRVRPWNDENTRKRLKGKYYEESWNLALAENTDLISITSFNEWHEGTQIEKSIPKRTGSFDYLDFLPHGSDYYLFLTKQQLNKYSRCKQSSSP